MHGRVDKWRGDEKMDGWMMDGWVEEWMEEWMDGYEVY